MRNSDPDMPRGMSGSETRQACKPDPVENGHRSRTAVAGGLERPTRSSERCGPHRAPKRLLPIRPFSRRGLPCRRRHRRRGGLLPHPFTLACAPSTPKGSRRSHRRFAFCGTFPGLAPGGRYPPPCPEEPGLSSDAEAPATVQPARRAQYARGARAGEAGRATGCPCSPPATSWPSCSCSTSGATRGGA